MKETDKTYYITEYKLVPYLFSACSTKSRKGRLFVRNSFFPIVPFGELITQMTTNDITSWHRMSDKIDGFDLSPSDAEEVHVLAVDDSFVDRKIIERLLTISSCKVTAVDSGRRALQFLGLDEEQSTTGFHDLKVDLIITDYCMPGMTGYELLKKIKESSTFKEIPVVIMSSENILARVDRCLEDGAEDFIVKPVKLSDVKRMKDILTKDVKLGSEGRGINKRKLRESCDLSSSPPSVISSSPSSISRSLSPPTSPSIHSSSALFSPSSTLDSPDAVSP